uniref:Uncharacterized protein n=1 Tax=Rangifer tarandus platyrhynchus TaxID=3082113 RepID=A0ACB0E8I9_RANTA|nr:unnamed protein product [Rangifer tarandus platyrhynchus]
MPLCSACTQNRRSQRSVSGGGQALCPPGQFRRQCRPVGTCGWSADLPAVTAGQDCGDVVAGIWQGLMKAETGRCEERPGLVSAGLSVQLTKLQSIRSCLKFPLGDLHKWLKLVMHSCSELHEGCLYCENDYDMLKLRNEHLPNHAAVPVVLQRTSRVGMQQHPQLRAPQHVIEMNRLVTWCWSVHAEIGFAVASGACLQNAGVLSSRLGPGEEVDFFPLPAFPFLGGTSGSLSPLGPPLLTAAPCTALLSPPSPVKDAEGPAAQRCSSRALRAGGAVVETSGDRRRPALSLKEPTECGRCSTSVLFRAAAVETMLQGVGGQGPQYTGRPPWSRAFSRSRHAGRSSDSRGTRLFVSERRGSALWFRFTSGTGSDLLHHQRLNILWFSSTLQLRNTPAGRPGAQWPRTLIVHLYQRVLNADHGTVLPRLSTGPLFAIGPNALTHEHRQQDEIPGHRQASTREVRSGAC